MKLILFHKSWNSRSTKGKSLLFLAVIVVGYAMGILWLLLAIFLMKKLEKIYMEKQMKLES